MGDRPLVVGVGDTVGPVHTSRHRPSNPRRSTPGSLRWRVNHPNNGPTRSQRSNPRMERRYRSTLTGLQYHFTGPSLSHPRSYPFHGGEDGLRTLSCRGTPSPSPYPSFSRHTLEPRNTSRPGRLLSKSRLGPWVAWVTPSVPVPSRVLQGGRRRGSCSGVTPEPLDPSGNGERQKPEVNILCLGPYSLSTADTLVRPPRRDRETRSFGGCRVPATGSSDPVGPTRSGVRDPNGRFTSTGPPLHP